MVTLKELIQAHRSYTGELDAMKKRHKQEAGAVEEKLALLESGINKLMLQDGISSTSTDDAVAYRAKWRAVRVEDWEKTVDWLVSSKRWDLLTKALNKSGVLEEFDDREGVPGLRIETGWKLHVRRK